MRPPRRAFSLIELLVVIALLGVLLGLLLPAVQKVRAAAARIQCTNNLKQIGLALHNYHDTNSALPPGVTSSRSGDPYRRMAWLTRLLPFLEHDPLWRATVAAYQHERRPFTDPPHVGFGTPVRLFSCPADGRTSEPQVTHRNRRPALTSYVGVLGTAYDQTDGVLFLDSGVRLTDIADGTSNTVMAGERPPSADFWYGWWYAGVGQAGTGSADMLLGARERNWRGPYVKHCPEGPYRFQEGRVTEQCDLFHFWSLHSGGGHFLFASGAVRFLAYSADPLLPALATRSGGEPVALPD
jgi:prepilin-type N-terminal cleavage/methylation domain-containing protein